KAREALGRPGSADVSHGWTPCSGWRAEISGQAFYIGQSFLTFERGAINAKGGYGIGRVQASLMSRRWRLNAYVDNVTDSSANTFAFGNPFSREVGSQATPPRPRTGGASARLGILRPLAPDPRGDLRRTADDPDVAARPGD
ncbi:MAG TPA: hypothetical protein VHN73_03760, partial [Phenylobacterium sp.]|nr:hypothetical protein [Phenylobacterium sp.]